MTRELTSHRCGSGANERLTITVGDPGAYRVRHAGAGEEWFLQLGPGALSPEALLAVVLDHLEGQASKLQRLAIAASDVRLALEWLKDLETARHQAG